jgi:hypothetical protein
VIHLARAHADQAAQALEHVASKPGGGIQSCYNAACMFAKAAALASTTAHTPGSQMESRRNKDRAIALLRRAVAMGFKEWKLLASDQDLSALPYHPDFQILMMDLALPTDPFRK